MEMPPRVPFFLVSVVAVAALLANRGAVGVAAISAGAADAMEALRRVEEVAGGFAPGEDVAAYPHRRALYDVRYIDYHTLMANNPACGSPCAAQGQPYTGRNCLAIYGCRS